MSIVINGGGIIGSILALMLSNLDKGNLEISLIEHCVMNPCNDFSLPYKNPRVIVLSRGAYFELMKTNISTILLHYSTIVNKIEISEFGRFSKIFIHSKDYGLSELGYVIELHNFQKELFNLLCKKSNINMYYPATITHVDRMKSHNIVFLNNGKKIISKLIIAADGAYSKLADSCGIKFSRRNYHQTAVVVEIITEIKFFGQAFERFTPAGSLAVLPMSNGSGFLIWCISNRKKKEILEWNKDKFIQKLQSILGWRLGKILDISTRCFYDLCLIYANNHIDHRLALVGNAAQKLHPIAGQGFNLGMRDIITLVKLIDYALCSDIDIGDYSILYLYQKKRRLDQDKIIKLTDGLVRLFSNHYIPLIIIRNLGLFFTENNFILKNFLVQKFLYWNIN